MIHQLSRIHSSAVHATDGNVGRILDFYFGVNDWRIRYILVDTNGWLRHRPVFIPPGSVRSVDSNAGRIDLNIDKAHIEKSPPPESAEWFSADFERRFRDHFGLTHSNMLGTASAEAVKAGLPAEATDVDLGQVWRDHGDIQWRRCDSLRGHHILATDGEIGHVEDFLVDTWEWTIPLLVVKTRNLLPGRHVLVETERIIETISWHHGEVRVNLTRNQVKSAPEYQEGNHLTHEDLEELKHTRETGD